MNPIFTSLETEIKLAQAMREVNGAGLSRLKGLLSDLGNYFNESYEHSKYTAMWAGSIAEQCNVPKEYITKVYLSGLLHDIGKLKVPRQILSKEGKLTEEEYNIIQGHSKDGYRLVKDYVPEDVSLAVLQHHERLDGTGYPCHYKADKITEIAKIIMVADSFDAMIVRRVYHRKRSYAEAIAELRKDGEKYEEAYIEALEEVLIKGNGVLEMKSG